MNDTSKVSLIIATHNNAETISNCIESIWCRDLKDIEVIAVDVNSTDGTKEILAKIEAEDENVIYLADSMGSIGHAKNIGLGHASGDYLIFVEPGDDFHSNALEYMCNKLDEETKYDMFVCDTDSFWDDSFGRTNEDRNRLIGEANRKDSRQREMESRLVRNWIFDNIILYRQEYLRENGLKHYEMPGYGSQDAAFRFLSLIKGKFFLSVEVIYDRRFDIEDSSITDTRSALDVSNEFRFRERENARDSVLRREERNAEILAENEKFETKISISTALGG